MENGPDNQDKSLAPSESSKMVPPAAARGAARMTLDKAIAQLRLWQEAASFSAIAFAVVIGLAALGWAWLAGPGWVEHSGFFRRGTIAEPETPAAPQSPTVRRALDGAPVPEGTPEPEYFAVMIDNMADAWPLSGVAKAPLVYEAPVEGGITRLMAVFPADAAVEEIGPVRSARPYYVDWADELGALYVHVGGSPEALEKLKRSDVRDLNEFSMGRFFWRDGRRSAPHNAYTSTTKLTDALGVRGARTDGPLAPWRYKEDAPLAERSGETFETVLGESGKWRVKWRYDRDTNEYTRVLSAGPQMDRDGTPVRAKNVLVQFAEVKVLDEVGRRSIATRAGGEALALLDGRSVGGTWEYDRASGRTRFHDAAGNELELNAGTTWVEIVPLGTPVTE